MKKLTKKVVREYIKKNNVFEQKYVSIKENFEETALPTSKFEVETINKFGAIQIYTFYDDGTVYSHLKNDPMLAQSVRSSEWR